MFCKFKSVVVFFKILTCLQLSSRYFGNILHDIAAKYDHINIADLRKLEKISISFCRNMFCKFKSVVVFFKIEAVFIVIICCCCLWFLFHFIRHLTIHMLLYESVSNLGRRTYLT